MRQIFPRYSINIQFMTIEILYTHSMEYLASLLAHNAIAGAFFIVLLFLFCFLCVHVVKYAKIGWQTQRKAPPKAPPAPPQTPKEEKPAQNSEPIYYIVERKKARSKHRYSEPREIRFK